MKITLKRIFGFSLISGLTLILWLSHFDSDNDFWIRWGAPVWAQNLFIKKISVDVTVKKHIQGKVYRYDATYYYKANGDMVSHFKPPLNYYMVNNSKGEVRIYNPETNILRTVTDPYMGSSSSYFNCFINYRTADMKLRDYSFVLKNSKFERGHQISHWIPPKYHSKAISEIQLVHHNNKIIYVAYFNASGDLIKKTYYGKTTNIKGVDFPETITEISYLNKAHSDSTIEKSYFTNFAVNDAANHPNFEYKIPVNAIKK